MSDLPARPPSPSHHPAWDKLQLGIVPLRPLGIGDIAAGAVTALRENWQAMLGVSFAVALVVELLGATLFDGPAGDGARVLEPARTPMQAWDTLVATAGTPLLIGFVSMVLGLVLTAVVSVVVPRGVFGRVTAPGEALRAGLPKLPRLLGATLLTTLLAGGIGVFAALSVFALRAFGVLLAFGAIAAILYLVVAFAFSSSVIVVEDGGARDSLARSRELVHAVGWWRVAGVLGAAGVLTGFAATLLSSLFDVVSGGGLVAGFLASVLAGTVTTPLITSVQTLLYVDHRARTEGLDGLWREAGVED